MYRLKTLLQWYGLRKLPHVNVRTFVRIHVNAFDYLSFHGGLPPCWYLHVENKKNENIDDCFGGGVVAIAKMSSGGICIVFISQGINTRIDDRALPFKIMWIIRWP